MIQRRTQTEAYWRTQFSVAPEDVTYVQDLVLDRGAPVGVDELAQALIEKHVRREEESIRRELSRGPVYQPKDAYKVGQQILFPALNYALGTVIDSRAGRSPDHGAFTVIKVQIEGEKKPREFASELEGAHALNLEEGAEDLQAGMNLLGAPELYGEFGEHVVEKLGQALAEREGLVAFGDEWFLQDLLVPISEGQLNIAEALIEIRGRPLQPGEFLDDLELPGEVSQQIRLLSLNCALAADKRFDNVGDSGRDIWYLRRMTPAAVVNPPEYLSVERHEYDRSGIDDSLLLIEREIDDEASGEEVLGASRPLYRTSITLTYPHWRAGTLPLTVRTRGLFPEATAHHFPIILVDGQSGDRMQGWVVGGAKLVYGLEKWYDGYKLPVGAQIKLERTRDPRVITVDFEPRRLKNLWVPIAAVEGGVLEFQMRKVPIACEYDDKMTVGEANADRIDQFRRRIRESGESLLQTMKRILPELTKLSPQATVHAKTIYSAVNILRRTAPGPIFALLSTEPCFVSMGGGYWTIDETRA